MQIRLMNVKVPTSHRKEDGTHKFGWKEQYELVLTFETESERDSFMAEKLHPVFYGRIHERLED